MGTEQHGVTAFVRVTVLAWQLPGIQAWPPDFSRPIKREGVEKSPQEKTYSGQ